MLLWLQGCGGGGGGGGSSAGDLQPVSYTGNVNPAEISADSAGEMIQEVIGGGSLATDFTAASSGDVRRNSTTADTAGPDMLSLILNLNQQAQGELHNRPGGLNENGRVATAAVAINQSDSCDGGNGSILQSGTISDAGTGNLTLDFRQCEIDGSVFDGRMEVTVADYDVNRLIPLDMSTSIRRLTIQGGGNNIALGGSFRSLIDPLSNTEVITVNLTFKDNVTGESAKLENLVITLVYNNIPNTSTSSYSMTMTGRFYDSVDGYIDVSMDAPWHYYSFNNDYPYYGGALRITGNNAVEIIVSPVSNATVYVGVDDNGDGLFEHAQNMLWIKLGDDNTSVNTAPTANAGPDITADSPLVHLDGSDSTDPEYDLLTYHWTIVQAPATSGAVLTNAFTVTPSISMNVPGTYEITLLVSDGSQSASDNIIITAPGNVVAPVFMPYQLIDTGSPAQATAIGDVNGDGLNDVVLTTSFRFDAEIDAENGGKVFVFLQSNTGGLNPPVKYDVGIAPTHYHIKSVKVADINNDGRIDVIVSHENAVGVLTQNALGTLNPVQTYNTSTQHFANSRFLGTADFNNDGKTDVASAGGFSQPATVDVFLQNIGGALNVPLPQQIPDKAIMDIEAADINGDGLTDIITADRTAANQISVLYQQGGGTFSNVVGYSVTGLNTETVNGIGVGDLNGDMFLDVVVATGGNKPSSRLAVLYQDIHGNLGAPVFLPSYDIPSSVETGDFNGDGRSDVAVTHSGWHRLGVYLQQENGELAPEELYPVTYGSDNTQSTSTGDINGDGRDDVVIGDRTGLVILYNQFQ